MANTTSPLRRLLAVAALALLTACHGESSAPVTLTPPPLPPPAEPGPQPRVLRCAPGIEAPAQLASAQPHRDCVVTGAQS